MGDSASDLQPPDPVATSNRAITGFDVYMLDGGRWRAVHKTDRSLAVEHDDWEELFMVCAGIRVRHQLQQATDELTERRLCAREDGRTLLAGPGSGINV
ncbi:hypothetical protein [Spirillospora sp. CA-128828]|uniref:hypothetical protein n=1 Tax=Spirillospora sp. CA-128828 TaxID=3240033 RepID=UPI003D8EAF2B